MLYFLPARLDENLSLNVSYCFSDTRAVSNDSTVFENLGQFLRLSCNFVSARSTVCVYYVCRWCVL